MSIVCPSVTPTTTSREEFAVMLDRVASFASRVQIDLMDGRFAAPETISVRDIWWPEGVSADIHLMYQQPFEYLDSLIALSPHLVIIHAEAEGDVEHLISTLHEHHIKVGVALLQDTTVESARQLIELVDHVLIFSGTLGSYGGTADFKLLEKVAQIRALRPEVELGWDGGANQATVPELSKGGIDVINVGGAIQRAKEPEKVFRELQKLG